MKTGHVPTGLTSLLLIVGDANQDAQIAEVKSIGPGSAASAVPVPCQTWQDASDYASSYGPDVAYPALRLQIICNATANQSQTANVPTCRDSETESRPAEAFEAEVSHFVSTSAVEGPSNQHVSRLWLDVKLLDHMGQSMGLGTFPNKCNLWSCF